MFAVARDCFPRSAKTAIALAAAMHTPLPSWVNICLGFSAEAWPNYPRKLSRRLSAAAAVQAH
jgi:hypothetical protein